MEICCRHIGYSFRLAARVLSYAPSHRQDSTYHYLCYTSQGALDGMGNRSTKKDRKEGIVLFNDTLNTFYLQLYDVGHMVKDHSDSRDETCCCHMGYSFRLARRILLCATSHLCYTSRGALAGIIAQWVHQEGSIRQPIAP